MALPVEIVTRTVTYGPETDFQGNSITGSLTFTPSEDITWVAAGQGLHVKPITVNLNSSGSGSIDLICTDQTGFRNANGQNITNWFYTVTADLVGVPGSTRKFVVPSGVGSLDLDTMIPITTGGTTISVPVIVNSVAGRTGAVTLTKNDVGLSNADNTADASKPVSVAQAAALATKPDRGELFAVDTDYANLAAALTATATGGTLEIRGAYTVTTPFVINKSCEVRFASGGSITASTGHGINITASNVTLTRPVLVGSGSGTAGTACAIQVIGTAVAPITGITITAPVISAFNKYGIYLEQVRGFLISRPMITSVAYAAVTLLSCTDGAVRGGEIRTLTMPSGFTNAYGVAITRNAAQNLTDAPHSERITVDGVLVKDVPWEGIDTHAGRDLFITNNVVQGCQVGIAIVACNDTGSVETYAPQRCMIKGNVVDSLSTAGDFFQGIKVVGAGVTVGSPVEYAGGCVVAGNLVKGYGQEAAATTSSGIQIYNTRGAIVTGNTILEPGTRGIDIYHTNQGAVVTDNTVVDVWSNGGTFAAVIHLRSTSNSVTLGGNTAVRGAKSATIVNERGLYLTSATNQTINDVGNNFDSCTTPVADSVNVSAFGSRSKKVGFYGVTPVVRPASPGTAAGTDATVINALITALRSQGLVT